MTYLELVNRVLVRLRENLVTTVEETPYSQLIGELVNVVKRDVEDSWDWNTLRGTITLLVGADQFNWALTGSTTRMRVLDVINDTSNTFITNKSSSWFNQQFLFPDSVQHGAPTFYNLNGVTATGDNPIDLYPVPDADYIIRVNGVYPQADLVGDGDVIQVNGQLIVEGALSRAMSERGVDGGYQEQESRFIKMLGDLISI